MTMPTVSERQHRAMEAAAHGHSTLGIPKKVGEEFIAKDAVNGHAAGILYVAPDGDVLMLRRSSTEANYAGHWALPGGKGEDGETPEQTADREAREEMGPLIPESATGMKLLDSKITPTGMAFHTFAQSVPEKFVPTLNDEHSGYAWCPFDQLPGPMHPAIKATIDDRLGPVEDLTPEDIAIFKTGLVNWLHQEEEPEHMGAMDKIAMDRSSIRRIDQDGHLFVEMTPISKANVCPYFGREIPDFEKLGLDPERTYQLYRDPKELAKAAQSFAGKPLLLIHTPISADEHPREAVVGSIGNEVVFNAPYLMAPLNIWDGEAIDLIETDQQKELSCGYRYRADMTKGTVNGEAYDGVMRDIGGNHVALVKEGRAGSDVVVGDSKQETIMTKTTVLSRKAVAAQGALAFYLKPKLAQDAKIDLTPSLKDVTAKNFAAKRSDILAGIKKAVSGKLAQDADIEDITELLDALHDVIPAEDEDMPVAGKNKANDEEPDNKKREFLKGKLSAEDFKAYDAMEDDQEAMDEADEDDEDEKKKKAAAAKADAADEESKDMVTKKAMDAAIAKSVKLAQDEMRQTQREIYEAEETVRPYVGKLAMAHDSAADVYRTALSSMNIDLDGVHPSAFKAILKSQPLPGSQQQNSSKKVAMDAKGVNSFHEMYPGAKTHTVKTL